MPVEPVVVDGFVLTQVLDFSTKTERGIYFCSIQRQRGVLLLEPSNQEERGNEMYSAKFHIKTTAAAD